MKIYTGKGDKGYTSLSGDVRVLKTDERIEAYGTIDELNSYIGLIKVQKIKEVDKTFLEWIQNCLMTTAVVLASEYSGSKLNFPALKEKDIKKIEGRIDSMEKSLKSLSSFIIPGGNTVISYCHIARTVCRRAERNVLRIDNIGDKIWISVKFLNRLSDYLFVLSRKLSRDFNEDENYWQYDKNK